MMEVEMLPLAEAFNSGGGSQILCIHGLISTNNYGVPLLNGTISFECSSVRGSNFGFKFRNNVFTKKKK